MKNALVLSVSKSPSHTFSKSACNEICLLKGLGVDGDAHMGEKVKHRSRVAKDPNQPNLRQVHLIHAELFDELAEKGFQVRAGELGENITTSGVDLLGLPEGTVLSIGNQSKVKITGLRNPCAQLDQHQKGLTKAVLDRDEQGNLIRKSGVMGIVLESGTIKPGDRIAVALPEKPHRPLDRV